MANAYVHQISVADYETLHPEIELSKVGLIEVKAFIEGNNSSTLLHLIGLADAELYLKAIKLNEDAFVLGTKYTPDLTGDRHVLYATGVPVINKNQESN